MQVQFNVKQLQLIYPMSASIFDSEYVVPDDKMLAAELGLTKECLDEVCSYIKNDFGDLKPEWKFYGQKSGWVLKLFNYKRNVLFIVPCTDYFRAVFTFGENAFYEVLSGNLPETIKHELLIAKKYREGRTIYLDVRTKLDVENIIQLIKIKLSN